MLRTVISLSSEDKQWLDNMAKKEHVPMTELVRRAIAKYRKTYQSSKPASLEDALNESFATWKKEDSVAYVRKLREEWDH